MAPRFWPALRLLFFLTALAVPGRLWAAPAESETAAAPPPGKVFRLARVQANPYWSYTQTFEYVREYLKQAGWGDQALFPDELSFTWGNGGESRESQRERAREILARDDYDLILSFGTAATRALLAENERGRPIVGLVISNPLVSGLIAGPDDSGDENFTTVTYGERPGRYMFLLFHELMKFNSMGIMYSDDEDGRTYTYLEEAREVARERGFELIEYDGLGPSEPLADCEAAVRDLIGRGAEALFLPNIRCFDSKADELRPMFEEMYGRGILTFAAEDRDMVRDFALSGLIFSDIASLAHFQTDQIIQILSGASPGQVRMEIPFHSRILLNMAAAERLGIQLPIKLLAICDEIYLSLPGMDAE